MAKKPPRRPGRVPINHPSSDDGNDGDDRSDPEEVLANFGAAWGEASVGAVVTLGTVVVLARP